MGMCQLCRRRTLYWTLLLDWLLMAAEDQQTDVQMWKLNDTAAQQDRLWVDDMNEEVWDQEDWELRVELQALEHENMKAVWEQGAVVARAVQTTENDHRVLSTILALAVAFVVPTALPLSLAPPAPWQPPTA
ncbi:hypothetical protein Y1Q_0008871 [Alligator mississippiensis]|uniref:Uncharacterized protein n=1 Tax=Alligator mississippiensis TaxID=8496 RepID=A0A151NAE3_ALLMI|nr:hypothetical protein Y1Q_0008871 [Alligator mississippiensis]